MENLLGKIFTKRIKILDISNFLEYCISTIRLIMNSNIYIKYPRTYHLPWSEGLTSDDKCHSNVDFFNNKEVVITEKMDGENSTLYSNYFHARSIDGRPHWSQDYVRKLQGQIGYLIPDGWRVCGENLYAKHSIQYNNLTDFFLVFSIWNDKNECLSWDETEEYSKILNINSVPVLYKGIFSKDICQDIWNSIKGSSEGYVVRQAEKFNYDEFKFSVAKFVRKNHVTTSDHWKYSGGAEKNLVIFKL